MIMLNYFKVTKHIDWGTYNISRTKFSLKSSGKKYAKIRLQTCNSVEYLLKSRNRKATVDNYRNV